MSESDKAAKLAAMHDRAARQMREVTENPEMAKGVVGTIVFDLIRSGEDVSVPAILAALEATAAGVARAGISVPLARGALTVMSGLLAQPEAH